MTELLWHIGLRAVGGGLTPVAYQICPHMHVSGLNTVVLKISEAVLHIGACAERTYPHQHMMTAHGIICLHNSLVARRFVEVP